MQTSTKSTCHIIYIHSKNTIKKFFHVPIKIYNINILSGFDKKIS